MKQYYKDSIIEAKKLFRKCQGIMLIYLLIFYLLKTYILFPAINKIWDWTLSSLPVHYITEHNISIFLQYPYVLIIGLLLILGFGFVTVWEMSGFLLCYAYYEQDRPVKLIKLLYLSLTDIKQLIYPKNWGFFIFILIVMPLTDLYSATGMLSSFAIPEYIMDFIFASPLLCFLFAAIIFTLSYFALRWFYVIQSVLIMHNNFKTACKESYFLIKGRMIHQLLSLLFYAFRQILKICIIPGVLALLVFGITGYYLQDYKSEYISANITILQIFWSMFFGLSSIFFRMNVMSYLVANYHVFAKAKEAYTEPKLPDYAEKKKGHIFKFRFLKPLAYLGVILFSEVSFICCTIYFEENPEDLGYLTNQTLIAAHKGYSSMAPENTIPAFDKAVSAESANMIEMDIRESKDGIPIVIHDSTLMSAAGISSSVYDLNYDQIKSYTASYKFPKSSFPDAYIPTLEEVLQKYGNEIPLIIEIKANNRTPELPKKIVDLLHKYQCTETCVIHSGSYESLEKVKELDPSIKCGLIIAMCTGSYYNLPCADFFSVEHTFVTNRMLEKVHSIDKEVYAWTVNDTSSIDKMAAMDVDVVITDYPDRAYTVFHSFNSLIEDFIIKLTPDINNGTPDLEDSSYANGNY